MIENVKKRLEALGFTVTDDWVLSFVCGKVENHIKNSCNVPAVPEGLREVAVDLAAVASVAPTNGGSQERSPFMPSPPGGNKKEK